MTTAAELCAEIGHSNAIIQRQIDLALPGIDVSNVQAAMAEQMATKVARLRALDADGANRLFEALGNCALTQNGKASIAIAINHRVLAASAPQSSKGAPHQELVHIEHYATRKECATFDDPSSSLQLCLSVLTHRWARLGMCSASDTTFKFGLAFMILKRFRAFPAYDEIYDMVQIIRGQMKSLVIEPSMISAFPEDPEHLPPALWTKAYDADDPPIVTHIDNLRNTALNHIPTRSTSKLLSWNQQKAGAPAGPGRRNLASIGDSSMQQIASALAAILDKQRGGRRDDDDHEENNIAIHRCPPSGRSRRSALGDSRAGTSDCSEDHQLDNFRPRCRVPKRLPFSAPLADAGEEEDDGTASPRAAAESEVGAPSSPPGADAHAGAAAASPALRVSDITARFKHEPFKGEAKPADTGLLNEYEARVKNALQNRKERKADEGAAAKAAALKKGTAATGCMKRPAAASPAKGGKSAKKDGHAKPELAKDDDVPKSVLKRRPAMRVGTEAHPAPTTHYESGRIQVSFKRSCFRVFVAAGQRVDKQVPWVPGRAAAWATSCRLIESHNGIVK